jgi:SAM-dependent methyltransferase
MPDAISRFTGFAREYDAVRPRPPASVVQVIKQWSGAGAPDVVDLGAGTGLSAVIWAGQAWTVTAIEPSADMRAIAVWRLAGAGAGATLDRADQAGRADDAGDAGEVSAAGDANGVSGASAAAGAADATGARAAGGADTGLQTEFVVRDATAEHTGLSGGCADVVTASQAMHWFDPDRALPEIARLLRPGGVFAAYDCDWPPCIDWETDAAYTAAAQRIAELEIARGLSPPHAGKDHLVRLRRSGLFRYATEIAVHSREQGDAERLVAVALSQGGAVALLADGATEDELGLSTLREVAARRLPRPRTWWWTYRIRLAVR